MKRTRKPLTPIQKSANGESYHSWDDNGCCVRCGFDGADHAWQMICLRSEIGDDEFNYRRMLGEFNYGVFCERVGL